MQEISSAWFRRCDIIKTSVLSKLIHRFKVTPIKMVAIRDKIGRN